MSKSDLPIQEELDFAYVLGLMRPLHNVEGYGWLPELFTLIGHDNLIKLCKYAGGETITIPTLDELFHSIECMEYFYDVYITHKLDKFDIPISLEDDVEIIRKVYNAQENKA